MPQDLSIISFVITTIMACYVIGEKLFGGGNKLANEFATLKANTVSDVTTLRLEMIQKFESRDNERRLGLDAIGANIHALQMGLLEFRAKMAEEYMRRDSYYKANEELKKDFKDKHDDLKKDIGELKDQIAHLAQSVEANRKNGRQP